jgi:hypothetical protein
MVPDVSFLEKLISQEKRWSDLMLLNFVPHSSNKSPDFLAAKLIYSILSMRFKKKEDKN